MSAGHHWRRRFHISTRDLLRPADGGAVLLDDHQLIPNRAEVVAYPPTWWPTKWHFENVFVALTFLDSTAISKLGDLHRCLITVTQLTLVVHDRLCARQDAVPRPRRPAGLFILTLFVPGQVATIPTFIWCATSTGSTPSWGSASPSSRRPVSGCSSSGSSTSRCPTRFSTRPRSTAAPAWGRSSSRIVLPLSGPPHRL